LLKVGDLSISSSISNPNTITFNSQSSNAETNVINNSINFGKGKCNDTVLLIQYNPLNPSDTNCGINPHELPRRVEPQWTNRVYK
jgi:hypothetical protein